MLILERKVDQVIDIIQDGVTVSITVVRLTKHGGVKLGFEAPRSVRIVRREVRERDNNGVRKSS